MINSKIIKIASNDKYVGLKNIFTHKCSLKNSLCGDFIKVEFVASKTKIKSMRYETKSCILCEASASLLSNKIKFSYIKDLKKDINNLIKNFRDNNLIFPVKFKEFSYLLDKDNVSRTSCVTLPMEAFLKAFKDSQ